MNRYTRQVYATSCGPVALINAAKWAGYRVPRKEFVHYYGERCEWNPKSGTTYTAMSEALRISDELHFLGFCPNPKLAWLDRHLKQGHALIIGYRHANKKTGHFIFCPAKTSKFFYVVNKDKGRTVQRISRKTMKTLLCEQGLLKPIVYSGAWAIKPK